MARMSKTTVYLSDLQQRRLRTVAGRNGRSVAELIREAVDALLDSEPKPEFRSLGVGRSGGFDASKDEDWLEREWGSRR